jgi:hypothetical protein
VRTVLRDPRFVVPQGLSLVVQGITSGPVWDRVCKLLTSLDMRKAIEDVELGGVRIPAGTIVLANIASANRDPAVYDDPDRLDITRDDPPPLLTFCGGVDYCLGAPWPGSSSSRRSK